MRPRSSSALARLVYIALLAGCGRLSAEPQVLHCTLDREQLTDRGPRRVTETRLRTEDGAPGILVLELRGLDRGAVTFTGRVGRERTPAEHFQRVFLEGPVTPRLAGPSDWFYRGDGAELVVIEVPRKGRPHVQIAVHHLGSGRGTLLGRCMAEEGREAALVRRSSRRDVAIADR